MEYAIMKKCRNRFRKFQERTFDEKKESDSIEILTNNKEFMNNNIEIKSITKDVKITREKAATGNVGPGGSGEGITPPNTGAESNLFISLSLLALLAGVISLKKLCK